MPARDEIQAPGGARLALGPLLHLSQSSGDTAAAAFDPMGYRHGADGHRAWLIARPVFSDELRRITSETAGALEPIGSGR
jgi:hypothetical protein